MRAETDNRRSSYLAIGRFVGVQCGALLLGLGLQAVLSRRLEQADYVRLVTGISLTSTLSVLVGGATPRALARLVAIDPGWAASARHAFWRVHLPCCSALALLLIVSSPLLARVYGDDALSIALCLLAVEFWLRAGFAEPVWQLLNGLGEHRSQARLMGTHSFIRAISTASIVLAVPTIQSAILGLLLTAAVSAFLAVIVVRASVDAVAGFTDDRRHQLAAEVRRWWTYGAFVDASLFSLPATSLWITMAFSPNHPQLAALTASYVLGQAIVPLLQAVNRGFVRLTVVEGDNASASHARQVMADVLQGLLPIVGLILLMAFTGGAWAMRVLFGANYIADWWLPGVVVLGMLGLSLSHLFSEALSNCGKLRERFVCMLAMGVCSITITLTFSKLWGPPGGAAAIGVTGVSVLLALGRLVQIRVGDFWPWRSLRDVLASAAIAMAIGGLISRRVSQDDWPTLAAITIAYFCGLLLTQEPGSQRLLRFLAARAKLAMGRRNPAIAENVESL